MVEKAEEGEVVQRRIGAVGTTGEGESAGGVGGEGGDASGDEGESEGEAGGSVNPCDHSEDSHHANGNFAVAQPALRGFVGVAREEGEWSFGGVVAAEEGEEPEKDGGGERGRGRRGGRVVDAGRDDFVRVM